MSSTITVQPFAASVVMAVANVAAVVPVLK